MNIKKRLAFVFALSTLMLASCSNDEALVEGTVDGGQKIRMTVTAQREGAGADSRTSLEDNNTGKLDCVWTEGDRLIVTNAEGVIKGHLDLISGAGEGFASFSGDLYGVRDGETVFNYYYLGTKNNATALGDVPNPYTVDYSNQAGTLESLSEYDVMTATAKVNVNKGNAPVENIRLERRISFARFQVNLPEDATVTHPCQVTLSGEQLANSLSLNMQTREVTTTKGNVTVTTSAEGDFYMTYLPTASPYTLTFTATDGTNTYEGEYTVKSAIGENVYFRKKLENADGVDYVGIPVEMKPVEPAKNYQIIYCINVKGIDDADPRVCESIPYNVTGNEYRVLNFTEVQRNTAATQEKDADFVEGYFADFLGWGTDSSAEHSWTAAGYGADYVAEETGDNKENNGVIDFTELSDDKFTEVEENGKTYQQLKLYAKGSFMNYILILDISKYDKPSSSENRNTGWIDYKISTNSIPSKKGYEFLGWTRHDKDGNEVDRDKPLQTGECVHIEKEDKYGEWNPNYTGKDGLNRPVKGQQTLILYPVWDPSPTVTTDGYGHGDW